MMMMIITMLMTVLHSFPDLLFNVCLALNGTEIAEILEIHNYYRRLMVVNATEGASVANMNKLVSFTKLKPLLPWL